MDSDDLRRARESRRNRQPDHSEPDVPGTPAMLGYVATPSPAAGQFFEVYPVTLLGEEREGAPAQLATDSSTSQLVYPLGGVPVSGSLITADRVPHRWVTSEPGNPPGCNPCLLPAQDLKLTISYAVAPNISSPYSLASYQLPLTYMTGVTTVWPVAKNDGKVLWRSSCFVITQSYQLGSPITNVPTPHHWIFEAFCSNGRLKLVGYGYIANGYGFPDCTGFPANYVPCNTINGSGGGQSDATTEYPCPGVALYAFRPESAAEGLTCDPLHVSFRGQIDGRDSVVSSGADQWFYEGIITLP